MEQKTVNINEIIPYYNNPRNNDDAVGAVSASIEECGYMQPIIVDENMVVLAGHTRLRALKQNGTKTVEVLVNSDMSEEQKTKFRILDNKTGELSQWDFDALRQEAKGIDFSFDFGIDALLDKGEELRKTKEKMKPKTTTKVCTCPRCGTQWED